MSPLRERERERERQRDRQTDRQTEREIYLSRNLGWRERERERSFFTACTVKSSRLFYVYSTKGY